MDVVAVVVDTVEAVESELFPVAAVFPHAIKANTAVQANTEITAFFISSISFLDFARTLVITLFYKFLSLLSICYAISIFFSLFI